jgi:hypothetical protein
VRTAPFHQLHSAPGSQPFRFGGATVERKQINSGSIGGVEAMRNINRPHRNIGHHAHKVHMPIVRRRLGGFPHRTAHNMEITMLSHMLRWRQ